MLFLKWYTLVDTGTVNSRVNEFVFMTLSSLNDYIGAIFSIFSGFVDR